MSFKPKAFLAILTAATCFTPVLAQAQSAVDPGVMANLLRQSGKVDDGAVGAPAAAGTAPATAATGGAQTDAGAAATDSAGLIGTCDAYFTRSQSLSMDLTTAYSVMNPKDPAKMAAILPVLQRHLDAIPAVEIKPEVCNGNHINAYTSYQYFQLNTLRDKGVDIGFPANLPIVKQPELNQSALAYVVGWIKYEQGDFVGAKAAFSKGLTLFPHNHELQNEYLATALQMNDGQATVDYAEKLLNGTYDLDDTTRGKVYAAHAIGLILLGRAKEADDSFTVSLRYSYSQDVADMQTQTRNAAAGQ